MKLKMLNFPNLCTFIEDILRYTTDQNILPYKKEEYLGFGQHTTK